MSGITVIVFRREYPERIRLCHSFPHSLDGFRRRKLDVLIHQWHIRIVERPVSSCSTSSANFLWNDSLRKEPMNGIPASSAIFANDSSS